MRTKAVKERPSVAGKYLPKVWIYLQFDEDFARSWFGSVNLNDLRRDLARLVVDQGLVLRRDIRHDW